MGIMTGIVTLLGIELLGFSVGDYVIARSADIGTGLLWTELKNQFPKKEKSLEGQLYDAIEASVKKYSELYHQDQIAPACEMLYGTWIKNGHLTEENVKVALSLVNSNYLAKRNVEVWYRQFYEEIIARELLYKWYMLHTTENFYNQIKTRDEKMMGQIAQCIGQLQMQNDKKQEAERNESQKQLCNQIFQRILREDIYLEQIYVSLHGKLRERNILNGRLEDKEVIVDTTSYIWEWYEYEKMPLLFLHGEPGIGKSSLVKMVAATMAAPAKSNGLVAFVELHRLAFGDKKSAFSVVEEYIERHYPWFFDKKLEGKRLLIIDGLDEIRYKVYENSMELVRELASCDWNVPWAGIISGRSQVIKKAIEDVRGEELEILPLYLDEYDVEKYGAKAEDPEDMLKEDLREIYWNKLMAAFQIERHMPVANNRFNELSKSPLLLFLVVWTIKHADSRFEDYKNVAELYDTIFRHIYTREYNRALEQEQYFNSKEYREYQQMLHNLGGCAFRNNSRTVSAGSIYDYCKVMGQKRLCENWIQLHKEDNPSKLVLLFFLREEQNEMDWQQSEIEFIHKTFYEYLAAIAIIEFLFRNAKEVVQQDHLKMMLYFLSRNKLDEEILKFMDEIIQNESLIVDGTKITGQHFATTLANVFTWGFHMNYPLCDSNLCQQCERIEIGSYQKCRTKVQIYESNLQKILEMFVKLGQNGLDLSCAEFSDANLIWWVFDHTVLIASHFEESFISGASFKNCILQDAIFISAVADRVEFSGADLKGADFSGAQLGTANFSDAVLDHTVFELANMEGAYLCRTVLKETKFDSANLTAANFDEAVLVNVDFHGADLTRADFSDVRIERVDWDHCIMEGTKLNRVKLIQFDLDDPNIIEMLAEADLRDADWSNVSDEKKRLLRNDWD